MTMPTLQPVLTLDDAAVALLLVAAIGLLAGAVHAVLAVLRATLAVARWLFVRRAIPAGVGRRFSVFMTLANCGVDEAVDADGNLTVDWTPPSEGAFEGLDAALATVHVFYRATGAEAFVYLGVAEDTRLLASPGPARYRFRLAKPAYLDCAAGLLSKGNGKWQRAAWRTVGLPAPRRPHNRCAYAL